MSLSTQWIPGPHGGRLGLNYVAVPVTAGMLGIVVDDAMLLDLRIMEAEALTTWAARA